ncbi:hypothetical protein CAP39_11980 [Sphingomonas sp. IBVSS1]|nr:hypothetical protein CAP39_11980 [Sphingomonas sp. IBVSS1]
MLLAAPAVAAPSLLVVNQGDASVSIVDPVSLAVVGTIAQGMAGKDHAHEAAVSADGQTAYLPVYGDSGLARPGSDGRTILLADLPSRRITGQIDLGRGLRPHMPMLSAKTGMLYVTTELDQSVTIIDPGARAVVGRIPTGSDGSHMLALSHDARLGYTVNYKPGTISVLDLQQRRLAATIPVAETLQRITISADDKWLFTSDNSQPRLAVIDTASRTVRHWVALPGTGQGSAASQDGRWLLVTMPRVAQVAVIDLRTMAVARTITTGKTPVSVLIQPDQTRAHVANAGDGTVSVIDMANWQVIKTIATAPGADGLAWASR